MMFHRHIIWLVVSTPLNNIGPLGLLFPISRKVKNVPVTTNQLYNIYIYKNPNKPPVFYGFPMLRKDIQTGCTLNSTETPPAMQPAASALTSPQHAIDPSLSSKQRHQRKDAMKLITLH